MVTLPDDFVQLSIPGYYWNTAEHVLYSCKITGVLRPMKLQKSRWIRGMYFEEGYQISHNGVRRGITKRYLMDMPIPTTNQVFPRMK